MDGSGSGEVLVLAGRPMVGRGIGTPVGRVLLEGVGVVRLDPLGVVVSGWPAPVVVVAGLVGESLGDAWLGRTGGIRTAAGSPRSSRSRR